MNIEKLPVVSNMDEFFKLDSSISEEKIKSLVGKYIYFEQDLEEGKCDLFGKLISFKDNTLEILIDDLGTNKMYDGLNKEELSNFCYLVPIDSVIGLEELKQYNENLVVTDEYKNKICKITNFINESIIVYVHNIENGILEFQFKYEENKVSDILEYPVWLITNIEIIN